MNPNDVGVLKANLNADGFDTELCNIYLKQFVKQDQFTEFVKLVPLYSHLTIITGFFLL